MKPNVVVDALLGVAVGDALGVPYEFRSRVEMKSNPATDMVGGGAHGQLKGTWSDDSSLTFCLAEALLNGYDLREIAFRFINWRSKGYWSARGSVFDIGITTSEAISRLSRILSSGEHERLSEQKYYGDEDENGNGSLMRILPLVFEIKGFKIREQFQIIWDVSALTHRHIRAAMCCLIYLRLAAKLMDGAEKDMAYQETRSEIREFWEEMEFAEREQVIFGRFIQQDVRDLDINQLRSSGYVIEVLEASLWFFLKCENYRDTVLSIINLGDDTDTGGAIVGGLAGIYYGRRDIPQQWLESLARKDDIVSLGSRLQKKYDT